LLSAPLATSRNGAVEGTLLGHLLGDEEQPRSLHVLGERGSRDRSAEALGKMPRGVGEDAVAGE
jgi:hypothetical protein